MPTSANYYVSPLSASNVTNFVQDVSNIAAQQGGGTGLIFVAVSDNLEGLGVIGNPLKTKDNIQVVSITTTNNATINNNLSASTATVGAVTASAVSSSTIKAVSVTASFNGDGSQVTNITASNIPNWTPDVRSQLSAGTNLNYSSGQFALNANVATTSVTASFNGNGSQVTDITASNVSNWTTDVRSQLSGSQYVAYSTSSGVISLPQTGSILGTTPIVLGQTASVITGLTSISASVGTFSQLTASSGSMSSLTVGSLFAGSIFEGTSSVQPLLAGTQIIPTTSLVKVSSSSGLDITLTASPTIKIAGYPEGTRITVINIGTGRITFTKDVGNTTRLKLVGGKSFGALEFECIPFVLVSGSSGFYWCEATRGA